MDRIMNLEFRVWSKLEKAYGVRADLGDGMDFEFSGGYCDLGFCLKNPDKYSVELFTGVFDSEGNKIFEGDSISLKAEYYTVTGIVVYDPVDSAFLVKGKDKVYFLSFASLYSKNRKSVLSINERIEN